MTGLPPIATVMPAMVPQTRAAPVARSPGLASGVGSVARPDRLPPGRPIDVERDAGVVGRDVRLRRRGAETQVRIHRGREADVLAGELGEDPLLLEHVAVGLERIASRPDGRDQLPEARLEDVDQPPLGRLLFGDRAPLLVLDPGLVLVQVVEQQPRLALEGDEPGQALELPGVEPAVGDRDLEPDDVLAVAGRLERDLVDREAELVEPPDPGAHRVPVVGGQLGLQVELVPDRRVAGANGLGRLDRVVRGALATLHRPEVGQTERDVLDEDVEVVLPLSVRQRRVDLARLGVDEEGLDLVAVATEQRVGERAIAPEHAGSVEVHQEPRHRVEQPVAVWPRAQRESHEQAAVLDRELQVFGHDDGRVALRGRREPHGRHGRQALRLEVAQHRELGGRHLERLLLERIGSAAAGEEPDEMARGADGQLANAHPGDRPVLVGAPLARAGAPRAGRAARPRPRAVAGAGTRSRCPRRVPGARAAASSRPDPWSRHGRAGQSFLRR